MDPRGQKFEMSEHQTNMASRHHKHIFGQDLAVPCFRQDVREEEVGVGFLPCDLESHQKLETRTVRLFYPLILMNYLSIVGSSLDVDIVGQVTYTFLSLVQPKRLIFFFCLSSVGSYIPTRFKPLPHRVRRPPIHIEATP